MINAICSLLYLTIIFNSHRAVDIASAEVFNARVEVMEQMTIDTVLTPAGDRVAISSYDIALIEHCVMSEAGSESLRCQEAVACVILNRWLNPERYPDDIYGVIYEDGQFACSMSNQPTVSVRLAVHDALADLNTGFAPVPYNCYYFRNAHYHNFGIPYCNIDNTYFSLADDSAN